MKTKESYIVDEVKHFQFPLKIKQKRLDFFKNLLVINDFLIRIFCGPQWF